MNRGPCVASTSGRSSVQYFESNIHFQSALHASYGVNLQTQTSVAGLRPSLQPQRSRGPSLKCLRAGQQSGCLASSTRLRGFIKPSRSASYIAGFHRRQTCLQSKRSSNSLLSAATLDVASCGSAQRQSTRAQQRRVSCSSVLQKAQVGHVRIFSRKHAHSLRQGQICTRLLHRAQAVAEGSSALEELMSTAVRLRGLKSSAEKEKWQRGR